MEFNFLFSDFLIILYILFAFVWNSNFSIPIISEWVNRLGLYHEWPMFVWPQMDNIYVNCEIKFKDGSTQVFDFSGSNLNSLVHRKYVDCLAEYDFLQACLADYVMNFSGLKDVEDVSIGVIRKKIEPFNEDWEKIYSDENRPDNEGENAEEK
jgi:hypothetical protein